MNKTSKSGIANSEDTRDWVLIDSPGRGIRRLSMNYPEKHNALCHPLRAALLSSLQEADADGEVRVIILRGAGPSFSAGYELGDGNEGHELPFYTSAGEGQWPRHVTEGWMSIWDLATPVIAQVHGYCLAGGSELATGCDLVYMADDASMGYPAVRFGVPDMHFHPWLIGMRKAMEMMLTGDSICGAEAVQLGWANGHAPAEQLDELVLGVAERIARLPAELAQLNKRVVHRQMEHMGLRNGIRAGTELCALGMHTDAMAAFLAKIQEKGVHAAAAERDAQFQSTGDDKHL